MTDYKNFYFCNLDFGKQLTGVERAALKKSSAFQKLFWHICCVFNEQIQYRAR